MKFKLLILLLFFFFKNLKSQVEFKSDIYSVRNNYDTIFFKKNVIINREFLFNEDTIKIISYYKNEIIDFSFYYPELWDSTRVFFNSKMSSIENKKFIPYMQRYFNGYDSLLYIEKNSNRYYVIFNTPFFCNGIHCSNLSVIFLIINKKNEIYCYEMETKYTNSIFLKRKILSYIRTRSVFDVNKINKVLR